MSALVVHAPAQRGEIVRHVFDATGAKVATIRASLGRSWQADNITVDRRGRALPPAVDMAQALGAAGVRLATRPESLFGRAWSALAEQGRVFTVTTPHGWFTVGRRCVAVPDDAGEFECVAGGRGAAHLAHLECRGDAWEVVCHVTRWPAARRAIAALLEET